MSLAFYPKSQRAHRSVDHLDFDKLNNSPSNLVPSCLDCNTKRVQS